jgi:hypothetical protein
MFRLQGAAVPDTSEFEEAEQLLVPVRRILEYIAREIPVRKRIPLPMVLVSLMTGE